MHGRPLSRPRFHDGRAAGFARSRDDEFPERDVTVVGRLQSMRREQDDVEHCGLYREDAFHGTPVVRSITVPSASKPITRMSGGKPYLEAMTPKSSSAAPLAVSSAPIASS